MPGNEGAGSWKGISNNTLQNSSVFHWLENVCDWEGCLGVRCVVVDACQEIDIEPPAGGRCRFKTAEAAYQAGSCSGS